MGLFRKLGSLLDHTADALNPAPAAAEPMSKPPEPQFVWQLLDSPSGTHMNFLDPNYAPVGLIDMIVEPPRLVLDVGCYCGATGALIKERWPEAIVIGIEPLAEAADYAAGRIDRVLNCTLQEANFAEIGIAPNSFDAIIFADVLEHMYNPWSALEMAQTLLTEDGVVLASIPNVRNMGLINNLVNGTWKYEGAGLLDVTHIRFFTLAQVREMFAQTGYEIAALTHGIDPPFAQLSEMEPDKPQVNLQFGSLGIMNASIADRRELATRQFFVRAFKSS
jgi:O-antigen biosynthesis protein